MIVQDEFKLATKIGEVEVMPTGLVTLSARSPLVVRAGKSQRLPVTVEGVPLVFSAQLVFEKGEWRTVMTNAGPRAWGVYRHDTPPNQGLEGTVGQIRAVKAAVLEAVTAFHAERPDAFVSAERTNLLEHLEDCQADVERARDNLNSEEAALAGAENALARFNREYPR